MPLDTSTDAVVRRLGVVLNPVHRGAERIARQLQHHAGELGWSVVAVRQTTIEAPGAEAAAELVASGADRIVVIGGDGTLRQVAGVLSGSPIELAFIPTGTANLFSRNVRHMMRGFSPIEVALAETTRPIDVGWAEVKTVDGCTVQEPFVTMLGHGHDADVVAQVSPQRKRRFGWLAYFLPAAREMAARGSRFQMVLDGAPPRELTAWSVLVVNGSMIPGATITPQSRLDDGVLEVVIVSPAHFGHWALIAAKGVLRMDRTVAGLDEFRASRVVLRPDVPLLLQLDGDVIIDVTQVTVSVAAGALQVCSGGDSAPDGDGENDDGCQQGGDSRHH